MKALREPKSCGRSSHLITRPAGSCTWQMAAIQHRRSQQRARLATDLAVLAGVVGAPLHLQQVVQHLRWRTNGCMAFYWLTMAPGELALQRWMLWPWCKAPTTSWLLQCDSPPFTKPCGASLWRNWLWKATRTGHSFPARWNWTWKEQNNRIWYTFMWRCRISRNLCALGVLFFFSWSRVAGVWDLRWGLQLGFIL